MPKNSRTDSQKNTKRVQQKPRQSWHSSPKVASQIEVIDALQRVKSKHYPNIKSSDMLLLQQSMGNRALRQTIQQHSIPEGRRGVGEEEDQIQAQRDPAQVQRHSIPEGRRGFGQEEDVIQAKRERPRQSAFGRIANTTPARQLWGNNQTTHIQRKNGKDKGKAAPKGADPKAAGKVAGKAVKEDPAQVKQAKQEHAAFVGGGPYRFNDYVPDFTENFGKFDAIYNPSGKQFTAKMRVKFTFPDLPVPKGKTIFDQINATVVRAIHSAYAASFIGQVHKGWSGKYAFRNIRQPQSVWGTLNPINAKINVTSVKANQHYTMKAYLKKAGTANVSPNPKKGAGTVTLFKGDLDPSTQSFTGSKQTAPDEVARLRRNLPKIRFANNATAIDAKYIPDLRYVADYLKRMNRPKFNINVTGHASKTGNEPQNVTLSQGRAKAVHDKLQTFGVTNHKLSMTGVGSMGATAHGSWRKVDFGVTVDKGFSNIQDTTLHEFGHMMGLDDEYVTGRPQQLKHQRKFVRKMLGDKAYGKGQENKYADEVTKVDPLSSASVMESGNEIRVYHYVTMWQALYDTAAKASKQPATPFTWKDWKVIG